MKKLIFILSITLISIFFLGCTQTDTNNADLDTNLIDQNTLVQTFEEFSIIVLPDTQKYSESYPELFYDQTNWIVENKGELMKNILLAILG